MEPLTQCEYQVANEAAKGHTPVEIADVLKYAIIKYRKSPKKKKNENYTERTIA